MEREPMPEEQVENRDMRAENAEMPMENRDTPMENRDQPDESGMANDHGSGPIAQTGPHGTPATDPAQAEWSPSTAKTEDLSTADIASTGQTENRAQDRRQEGDQASATEDDDDAGARLLVPEGEATDYRDRWLMIQGSFVDEPQRAVSEADRLVADLMQRIAQGFTEERARLEGTWRRGDQVSTEDLRVTLRHYRLFLETLLS